MSHNPLTRLALRFVAPAALGALALFAPLAIADGSIHDMTGTVYMEMEAVELNVIGSPEAAGTWCELHHDTLGPVGGMTLEPGNNYFMVPYAPGTYYAIDGDGDNPHQWDPAY